MSAHHSNWHLVFKSRKVTNPHPRWGKKLVRETACLVHMTKGNGYVETPLTQGMVRQHVIDQDDKFLGQKRALEKALRMRFKGEDYREIRREIWEEFFRRSKRGKAVIGEDQN